MSWGWADWGETLTWTCMVCGRERPDSAINVAHRALQGMEDRYPETRVNVRYCNDNPSCASIALADGPWKLG